MTPPRTDPLHFELPGGGQALFTSRADGSLSTVRAGSLSTVRAGSLSTVRAQSRPQGVCARERLRRQLALRRLCAGPQVHGTDVQRVLVHEGAGAEPLSVAADGRATALAGVGVMVLTADCLPVLLGAKRAVAAVHAGWRGLAAGVLEEGVRALRELDEAHSDPGRVSEEPGRASVNPDVISEEPGHTRGENHVQRPSEIVAVIGPGAGPCCYEVGPEVHEAFSGAHRRGNNLDLPALARERLLSAGVNRVEQVQLCTICDERFFSHRREGRAAGRQVGVAWLS